MCGSVTPYIEHEEPEIKRRIGNSPNRETTRKARKTRSRRSPNADDRRNQTDPACFFTFARSRRRKISLSRHAQGSCFCRSRRFPFFSSLSQQAAQSQPRRNLRRLEQKKKHTRGVHVKESSPLGRSTQHRTARRTPTTHGRRRPRG